MEKEKKLKQETIFSLLWNAFDKVGFQVIAFIIGLVTLRLLSPKDFGLIGALAIFTALSNILVESGFTSAMVRREKNTDNEYTAILCFNVFLSLFFYVNLYFCADLIAEYYKMPELVDLSRFIFLSILFNSFSIVQSIILTKELSFKKLSTSNICAAIISGVVTIILILNGYTYWALAWQILLQAAVKCIMLWIFSKWRPKASADFSIIKEVAVFSFSLILSSLLNTFVRYIYNPIIGNKFGEDQLGYYSEAYKFYFLPSNIISSTICGVAYPVLSKLNNDENRQTNYLRKMVRMAAFGIFPIMLGAMACFDNLTIAILTEKWKNIIPYFQILAIAGIITPFHGLYLGFLTLKGHPKRNFASELIRNILIVTPLFFLHNNIIWMLWSFTIANILSYCVDLFFIRKVINYKVSEQIKDILPYGVIALVMAIIVYSINYLPINSIWIKIILQISIGCVFYLTTCHIAGSVIVKEIFKNIKAVLLPPK